MTDFVDVRLHISVRPYLEYSIPEVSRLAFDVLIGDKPRADLLKRLETLRQYPSDTVVHSRTIGNLGKLCSIVITSTIEYLKHVEKQWIDFLRRVSAGLRHDLTAIRQDTELIRGVYERYRVKNPHVVEREYQLELLKLNHRLEEAISRVRTIECPTCDRPHQLQEDASRLKEAFASSYGGVDTKELMRMKTMFEQQMLQHQLEVVTSFESNLMSIVTR